MDNYPDHLAPEFNKGGGVETPFHEWWARVSSSFPLVPEEVAKEWLHRHWNHSPFRFLKSSHYHFTRIELPSKDLRSIRCRYNNFNDNPQDAIKQGAWICNGKPKFRPYLAKFMLEHRTFPSPPILLDNFDGHLVDTKDLNYYPKSLLLIEGHTRFCIASYLQERNEIAGKVPFWLMTQIAN